MSPQTISSFLQLRTIRWKKNHLVWKKITTNRRITVRKETTWLHTTWRWKCWQDLFAFLHYGLDKINDLKSYQVSKLSATSCCQIENKAKFKRQKKTIPDIIDFGSKQQNLWSLSCLVPISAVKHGWKYTLCFTYEPSRVNELYVNNWNILTFIIK